MKLSANRSVFAAAAKQVAPHAARRGHLPVLSGVHIDTDGDDIHLTCTDLDLTATVALTGHVMDAGTAIVPASTLAGFVAAGTSGEVQLIADGAQLTVGCGTARARLPLFPVEEWPRVAHATGPGVAVDAETVGRLAKVLHATSTDNARPLLTGVHIGGGKAVATDSYRLAAIDLEGVPAGLVPARVFHAACKVAEDGFVVAAGDRSVTVTHGTTQWTTATIEGQFPNWPQLVRDESPHHLAVDRDELLDVLRRVTVIDADQHVVTLEYAEGSLVVTRDVVDVGHTEDVIDAAGSWPGRVGFNARFLDDLLDACEPGPVQFDAVDPLKPVQVQNGPLFQLLMPVRLR